METNKVAIATRMGECTGYPLVWGGAVSIWNMHAATERITGECFLVEVDHRGHTPPSHPAAHSSWQYHLKR